MNKQNKSYCRYPFDSITVTNTGHMQMCCYAEWTGVLDTEETKIKDIDSIDDWFKGKYLTNVRKLMLDNKKLAECSGCYKREKQYGNSPRTFINEKYKGNLSEHSIKRVDLKLGNKCNLKCKMCFPYASSELWKEWKDLGWNSSEKDPNKDTTWRYYDGYFEEDYAWPKNKSNMDKIKEVALKSKIIHVTGGEPTLNPEFFDLLKYCIDKDVAKDIKLEVTTNATKIHPKFFDMAKQFKNLFVVISMDGVGKTYEYVRYPANYDAVYKNILEYNKFFKTLGKDSKLIFNFVLQYWNIHITIDVIKTLTPLAVNETTVPVMIEPLEYPKFMAWNILPEEYIKKIIREVVIEDKKDNEQLVKLGIIQFLRQLKTYKAQDYTALKQELIQFTTKQDTHRGIKLEDYIPNLSGFFR